MKIDEQTTRPRTSFWGHLRLVCTLTIKLTWLGCTGSPFWILAFARLVLFSLALSPGILRSAWYYATVVRKNLPYGPGMRHLADVYEPVLVKDQLAPVVIFVTGGAWVIGYKGWAVPLGRALAAQGVLVVAPDYRNCPQARIDGMISDVDRAIGWTLSEGCKRYGGDPDRVLLVGQSAGAHLCALLLLRKAEALAKGTLERWKPRDLLGFVGVSGPYHVEATATHWTARGFSRRTFKWIFGKGEGMSKHSPTDECARMLLDKTLPRLKLPMIRLVHGTADQSAPCVASELLEARLLLLGVKCEPTRIYKHWSHTDPILERPFAGDHKLHRDIFDLFNTGKTFDHTAPGCTRLVPQPLIIFAGWCVPF